VQNQNFIAGKNDNWGSLVIDMRSPKWQGILLDIVIPKVLAQGFDGIFLDTIDSAMALAQGKDAAQYKGMREGVLEFLRRVRSFSGHPHLHEPGPGAFARGCAHHQLPAHRGSFL
jgi:endo-alpha-1,4-polygalactosaminidase (GH114 family)